MVMLDIQATGEFIQSIEPVLESEFMTDKIPTGPVKRPETETPVVENNADTEEQKHKKMERMADRAANKANKDQQNYDQVHNTFSNI